jgi:glycosyltransferase involved in cell wall biosynthesis
MNQHNPPVSVVIPCYNQGQYIEEAISSVEKGGYPAYEIIIINDGSTEPLTLKVLSQLKEQGYCVIDQKNQGLPQARNHGIERAKNQYILPLDADDKIRKNYIQKGIDILKSNPEIGVVYGQASLFEYKNGIGFNVEFDIQRLVIENYIPACSIFRKTVWEDCGGYDTQMRTGWEDWDLWLSAVEKGWKFYYLPEIVFDYRIRSDSMSLLSNLPENRKKLVSYICNKHPSLYTTYLPEVIAHKDFAWSSEKNSAEHLTNKCNEISQTLEARTLEVNELSQTLEARTLEVNELSQTLEARTLEVNELSQTLEARTLEVNELTQNINELSQTLEARTVELNEIITSRTWKVILSIKSNRWFYQGGHFFLNLLKGPKRTKKFQTVPVEIDPANQKADFCDQAIERWLEAFKQQDKEVLAIYVPQWLGISSATRNAFEDCYPIAEHLTREQAEYYTNLLILAGVKHLISAGAAPGHLELIKAIKELNPSLRCDVTWHASYIQHCEDYGWSMMTQAIQLAKQGKIYKFGLAKKGMEKSFQAMMLRAEFLPNFVQQIPDSASIVTASNPQLGIWLSWIGYRKLPYAMIAAAQLVNGSVLNMTGVGYRAKEWAEMLGLKVNYFSDGPIPKEELYPRIKNTHLSLYLTSSECAPMLPIESLSLGVPCLISPVSHWFEDDEYLHSRLVVPYPERPEIIAQYIERAIEERDQIIERYKLYAERYNLWAKQQVKLFLQSEQ